MVNRYWLFLIIMVMLWGGFLKLNKQRFSEEKLWQMIETPSAKKNKTDDFCKYVTGLDPKEPDQRYVKIVFKCGDREALNTISWVTIKDQTVGGLINKIKIINGINNDKVTFDCNIDGRKAVMSDELLAGNRITCRVN